MISRLISFYSRVGRKPYDHPFIHGTEFPSMNRDIIDIIQGYIIIQMWVSDDVIICVWLPGLRVKSKIPETRKTNTLPASNKPEPSKAYMLSQGSKRTIWEYPIDDIIDTPPSS